MSTAPNDRTPSPEPANCHIGLRYGTREALVRLKGEMRFKFGRPVSYDDVIQVLMAEYAAPTIPRPNKGDDE